MNNEWNEEESKPMSSKDLINDDDQNDSTSSSNENETVYTIRVTKEPFKIRSIEKTDPITDRKETVFSSNDQPTTSTETTTSQARTSQKRILDPNTGNTNSIESNTLVENLTAQNIDKNAESDSELLEKEAKRPKPDTKSQDVSNNNNESEENIAQNNLNQENELEDVDLSDVRLYKPSEKDNNELSSTKKSLPKPRVKFTDPTKDEYWKNIYNTQLYKKKTLNFYDILNREFGYSKTPSPINIFSNCKPNSKLKQTPRQFFDAAVSSLNNVQRMKLLHSLNYHDGCVNSLNFNRIGTMLCSGSDDFQVNVYDWSRKSLILSFDSGHKSNVFQTKFMPYTGDSQIVTCARDGQVRLALISTSGSHIGTKKLAKHADSCHKLSIEYDSSNMFLSAGEDGIVFEVDLRQQSPAKILTVKSTQRSHGKLPLYSISTNPNNTYQFCVSGRDQYIRVYDKRVLVKDSNKVLKMFTPIHMRDAQRSSITSAIYNYDGSEIIGSFSDDDIYLFKSDQEETEDAKYRYGGHRNGDTIKGVNFYGARSEYIISGSDCGRIFFWEKESQQVVNYLKGDERGIVNVLEPHPEFPILATSGLDSDVKLWSPTSDAPNQMQDLSSIIAENQRHRDTNRHFSLSTFEFELLLLLMNRPHNRSFFRTRDGRDVAPSRGAAAEADDAESTNNSEEENERRINILRRRFFEESRTDDEENTTTTEEDEEGEESEDYYDFEHVDSDEDDVRNESDDEETEIESSEDTEDDTEEDEGPLSVDRENSELEFADNYQDVADYFSDPNRDADNYVDQDNDNDDGSQNSNQSTLGHRTTVNIGDEEENLSSIGESTD